MHGQWKNGDVALRVVLCTDLYVNSIIVIGNGQLNGQLNGLFLCCPGLTVFSLADLRLSAFPCLSFALRFIWKILEDEAQFCCFPHCQGFSFVLIAFVEIGSHSKGQWCV